MNLTKYLKKTAALSVTAAIAMSSAMSVSADTYTDNCKTTIGYEYLGTVSKGAARQQLYNMMCADSLALWESSADIASAEVQDGMGNTITYYPFGQYDLNELGLTFDDAFEVFETVKNDNPLFYFFDYTGYRFIGLGTTDGHTLGTLMVEPEYASGAARQQLQGQLTAFIDRSAANAAGMRTTYEKVRSVYKDVCDQMTYAYDSSGVPSSEAWAHNVIGPISRNEGVCESYARTYQMILSYLGVDAIFVAGYGDSWANPNAGHAWNFVKLDDGEYYGFDLTWCDNYNDDWEAIVAEGATYGYSREEVEELFEYRDGYSYQYFAKGAPYFNQEHLPFDQSLSGNYMYELPGLFSEDYYILGDVNDDFNINMGDLLRLNKYLIEEPVSLNYIVANTNGDDGIDMADAVLLQKYLLGYSETITRTYR